MSDPLPPATTAPAYVCAYCQTPIHSAEEGVSCPSCSAVYHTECWQENGGCGVYGCQSSPTVQPRTAMEIPAGFWGRERKNCPVCNVEIAAAAVRCKNCGTTFATAAPVDRDAFRDKVKLETQQPGARRMAITFFVLSVLPCTAPLGVVCSIIWRLTNRSLLRSLPSLYTALWTIGVIIGSVLTIGFVVFSMMYSLHKEL